MEPSHTPLSAASAAPRPDAGPDALTPEVPALPRERDALRIQAAAVAAQQAGLLEEEARFQQRRLQLEQQEKQLASHLEEKRQQLLQLRDEVRQAREELQQQRQLHAAQVGTVTHDLTRAREEVEEQRRQAKAQRHRLLDLRRHLKHRFHRHWAGERQTQRRREEELAGRHRRLDQEKASLTQERVRFNGERELGRRELEDAWRQLRQAEELHRQRQAEQEEQGRQLAHRAADLDRAAHRLEDDKRQGQEQRRLQEKEAEGLEVRVRNHRRKILDQQREIQRLETVIAARAVQAGERGVPPAPPPPALAAPPAPPSAELEERASRLREAEAEVGQRLTLLEQLAGELADQRWQLVEQGERLLRARQHWQEEHDGVANELEAVVLRLQEREAAIRRGEQTLFGEEAGVRQQLDQVVQLRHYLEGCQARLRARVAEWEGERDRLLVEVRDREKLAAKRVQVLGSLRGRWEKRFRTELNRLQASLAAAEKLRKEHAGLRDQWLRRQTLLEQKERELTEQTLALEQYRQEQVGQAPDSPAAEKQLEKLRRRWSALAAAREQTLVGERAAFQGEKVRFEERHQAVEKLARETLTREAELARRQTAWEQDQVQLHARHEQMRLQLHTASAQRQRCEQQLQELRDEVERIARLLLDENEPALIPMLGQAA